jgi:hypothetical protein
VAACHKSTPFAPAFNPLWISNCTTTRPARPFPTGYQDHNIRPGRLTDAARLSLVLWSGLFDWKEALTVVTPATFVRWHRKSFKVVLALEVAGAAGHR